MSNHPIQRLDSVRQSIRLIGVLFYSSSLAALSPDALFDPVADLIQYVDIVHNERFFFLDCLIEIAIAAGAQFGGKRALDVAAAQGTRYGPAGAPAIQASMDAVG